MYIMKIKRKIKTFLKIINCENFKNLLSLVYRIKDPENWEIKYFKLILAENRELVNTLIEYNEKIYFWEFIKAKEKIIYDEF